MISECSDLFYHIFVLMAEKNISLSEIEEELKIDLPKREIVKETVKKLKLVIVNRPETMSGLFFIAYFL